MGVLLAKFRKEKTTTEVLEKLEERIQQIEKYTFSTQEQKKRFVSNFLAISIGIYMLAFVTFYFFYYPTTWKDLIIYSVPLLIFPVFIFFFRKAFTWYFQRKLNKNTKKLNALRSEKKQILEQVMDKETYKVALSLLNRFGDKANGNKPITGLTPRVSGVTPVRPNLSMRSLTVNSSNQSNISPLNTSLPATPRVGQQLTAAGAGYAAMPLSRQLTFTPVSQELRRRTPFPIVDQQSKTVFDRIVDILVGDGPQDRFAMICKECFAHNGMALKEEFDFATFRCAFCNALNPSRKERPKAPILPYQASSTSADLPAKGSSDSSSDTSDSDTEKFIHSAPNIKLTDVDSLESGAEKEDLSYDDLYQTDTDGDKTEDEKSESGKEEAKDAVEIKKDI